MKIGLKKGLISIAAVSLLVGLGISIVNAAGSATLTLSPSSGSHNVNTTFSVTINEDSGAEAVNAVQADLTYDQAKLQFVSIDTTSSAFGVDAVATGGGGSVSIQRGKIGSLTGSQVVGSVTFKVLAGSGSTAVSFANSSQLLRASDNEDIWNHATTGGTYTLATPPTGGSTPPPSNTGSNTTTTKTTTGTTVPKSQTTIQQANPAVPVATTSNPTQEVAGYLVSITVFNTEGKPQTNTEVSFGEYKAKTDDTGVASFTNVKPGSYKVSVKAGKVQGDSTIVVADNLPAATLQEFQLKLKENVLIPILIKVGLGLLGLILLYMIWKFLTRNRLHLKKIKNPVTTSTPAASDAQKTNALPMSSPIIPTIHPPINATPQAPTVKTAPTVSPGNSGGPGSVISPTN